MKAVLALAWRSLRRFDRLAGTDLSVRWIHYRSGLHRRNVVMRADQLAFVHIPKTGGTTLRHVLREVLSEGVLVESEHMPVSRRCPPGPFRYVTILRDPVSRVWSHFNMVLGQGPTDPYFPVAERGLATYLAHCWEARNMTTASLAGYPRRRADETLWKLAWRNLERIRFVLHFETLEEDIRRLVVALGSSLERAAIPHLRKGTGVQPTDEERDLIARRNTFDRRLYDAWIARRAEGPESQPPGHRVPLSSGRVSDR